MIVFLLVLTILDPAAAPTTHTQIVPAPEEAAIELYACQRATVAPAKCTGQLYKVNLHGTVTPVAIPTLRFDGGGVACPGPAIYCIRRPQ